MKKKLLSVLAGLFILSCVQAQFNIPFPEPQVPTFKNDTLSILKYNAIPDGFTLNTKSINEAITDLSKKGGGVVFVPEGLWLTGPIVLKDNINLHLAQGATLLFTKDFSKYPLVEGNWEGLPQMRNQSPISASHAKNIAITGKGIVDGNGDAWRFVKKSKLTDSQWKKLVESGGVLTPDKKTWYPSEKSLYGSTLKNPGVIEKGKNAAFYDSVKDFLRPNLVVLAHSKNILLEGVTFQNSAAWNLHPLMSENIVIRNITVKNPWYGQNGDGIDVESCKNVLIENSIFDVGDDALCIKSGRDEAGRKRAMPTHNVIIRGCTVYASHGGFVIGSEMSGGAHDIYVSNCTFIGADIGLRFKTTRGRGGVVENIFIKDIYMKDIPGEAILFDKYYEARDPIPLAGEERKLPAVEFKSVNETTPVFRKFHISNVYVNGAEKGIFLRGIPEMPVSDIVLENMVIQAKQGIDIQESNGITLRNIKILTTETNPVVDIIQSQNIAFENLSYSAGAHLLFRVNGDRASKISIQHTDVSAAKESIRYELGATPSSTVLESTSPIWSAKVLETAMQIWPDSFLIANDKQAKWRYDLGVILKGAEQVWNATGDVRFFKYIQQSMDFYVDGKGNIKGYKKDEYNIDHINNGKNLLTLYRVTGKEKYKLAADILRDQLRSHPRTHEGGFWHKKIYPSQMWLDGLYMAQPFLAEYAFLFQEDSLYNGIALQFILMEKNALDKKTGLLYHGWDESKEQDWANKKTGQSPNFWLRSWGWYGMALVDVLDYFPASHPQRKKMVEILNRFVAATSKVQDKNSGLWYDVPNLPTEAKNYLESSGSAMLIYTYAKAVRKGYVSKNYLQNAVKGYQGLVKNFIEIDGNGQVNLKGTVAVSGLGGKPYRDGSFDYYMSEPVVDNDPKGLGAFILCATEMEMLEKRKHAPNKNVVLDTYYNNEWKKNAVGNDIRWHYVWDDKSNGGYAMLGEIFTQYGAAISSLTTKPTASSLKNVSVYIIVDPDHTADNANPNYMDEAAATTISNWVKAGGVLVMLTNDKGNTEFTHFNKLANKFGLHFNEDSWNRVQNDVFVQGEINTPNNHEIFGSPKKLFIKEYSSLKVDKSAKIILEDGGKNVMAVAKYGKGTVFALGDPWIYNEYLDGRKLPVQYTNYSAATEWVKWLLKQAK